MPMSILTWKLEPNSDPQEEQHVIVTEEPPLSHLHLLRKHSIMTDIQSKEIIFLNNFLKVELLYIVI